MKCKHDKNHVTDSVSFEGKRYRTRVCDECKFRWDVVEKPTDADMNVSAMRSLIRARRRNG